MPIYLQYLGWFCLGRIDWSNQEMPFSLSSATPTLCPHPKVKVKTAMSDFHRYQRCAPCWPNTYPHDPPPSIATSRCAEWNNVSSGPECRGGSQAEE